MKSTLLRIFVALCLCAVTGFAEDDPASESVFTKGKYIPDIATFLNIGACQPAGVSWDGKDVYFTSMMSGANQVYRIDEHGWPVQLTAFDNGVEFFALNWAGDRAVVGASTGGRENTQLYLLDPHSGRLAQITFNPGARFVNAIWSRDDRTLFYRSNEESPKDFFIYRLDVASGQTEKVFGDTVGVRGTNAIADLSEDGSRMIVSHYVSNAENDLYFVDLNTLRSHKMNRNKGHVLYDNVSLMPDNQTVWLTCDDNKEGVSRPAKMIIGSPRVEFARDRWPGGKWEVEAMGFTRDFKYQFAEVNEDGYSRLHIRDCASRREVPMPTEEGMYHFGGSDQDGNFYLALASATRAPDIWKWNPSDGEWAQLTYSTYAGIDRSLFREPRLIRYKSFDGKMIPAFLYLPPDYVEGKPVPFIIEAHGGPSAQVQPSFIRTFQYLLLNGYGVLAPNPRGSSGYGREYMALDDYKLRKNALKDYKAGVDWLIANAYTAPGMIGIHGISYGGYVALAMITEYPDLFNAAICVAGISNFQTALQGTAPYMREGLSKEFGPLSDAKFLRSISPIHKAGAIKTPLLVVHGENDPRVPVEEARQILAAVSQNGTYVDSLIWRDEGHGAGKRSDAIAEYRKDAEFFNRFLKPQDQAKEEQIETRR